MTTKVSIFRRWTGPIPIGRDGKPIPKNLWPRRRKHVWVVRWFAPDAEGKLKRPSKSFATREDAERFQAERATEFERKPVARTVPRKITLKEFEEEFTRMRTGSRGQRMKASSLASATGSLRRLAAALGEDTLLSKISKEAALRFLNQLRDEGLSAASVNRAKRTLRAAFQVAVDTHGYIATNPFAGIRSDKVPRKQKRYVTPEEFAALIKACETLESQRSLWWRAFLSVAYCGGLRYSEIVHLTWADIDFERDMIKVQAKRRTAGLMAWTPKSYQSRSVPIPAATTRLLVEMQGASPEGHNYVFISPARFEFIESTEQAGHWREGKPVFNNTRREYVQIVLKAAKAVSSLSREVEGQIRPTITMHDLRRSAITNWSKRVNLQTLRDLAGHSNISTTVEFYAQTTADQLALAREASDEALLVANEKQSDPKVTPKGSESKSDSPRHTQNRGSRQCKRGFRQRARQDSNLRPSD